MARETILLVEDETEIQELLRYNLAKEGYRPLVAGSGEEAFRLLREHAVDLILLDLMLPGIDGLTVCRRLKADPDTQSIPIIMLTAKGEETDIVTGLELGADDYVPKPFSLRVLIARIRSVLRRIHTAVDDGEGPLNVHDIMIHPGRHEVTVAGKPVMLTPTEFRVLHFLARRPGWVFTRSQIADAVHGEENVVTDRSVDVQIVGLRRKLGEAGKYVETVRGVGYRFRE
ncbi:MAG: response regulator [Planctomycetota bacterium]|nr:MAG: response regulator [Planctomycetota bacterium]